MYVKIMKHHADGDNNPNSYYLFGGVVGVEYIPAGEVNKWPSIEMRFQTDNPNYDFEYHHMPLSGNVYLMNDEGKTIDKYEVGPEHQYRNSVL